MSQLIRRRTVLGGAAAAFAAPLIVGRRASADDKSITVGIYTGLQGDVVRKQIIPPFEAITCTGAVTPIAERRSESVDR